MPSKNLAFIAENSKLFSIFASVKQNLRYNLYFSLSNLFLNIKKRDIFLC